MPKRIKLDEAYLEKIKQSQKPIEMEVANMESRKVPCKYCGFRSINKYVDLTGHFSASCPRCGQIAIYNAEDYRHYSYRYKQNTYVIKLYETMQKAI